MPIVGRYLQSMQASMRGLSKAPVHIISMPILTMPTTIPSALFVAKVWLCVLSATNKKFFCIDKRQAAFRVVLYSETAYFV